MENWFTYDWSVRQAPAIFTVDTQYERPVPRARTLLYCSCMPVDETAKEFSPNEVRRVERLLKKIQRELVHAAYVGDIRMRAQWQFYFYTKDQEDAQTLDELCEYERKLYCQSGSADEPNWVTYFSLLMPDAAKYQTEQNRKAIARLEARGDGLRSSRRITFLVFFPTEQDAMYYKQQARYAGFAIGNDRYAPEMELSYGVELCCVANLRKRGIDQYTTTAIRLAEPLGGSLLRWECPLVPKKHPLA
ncbi:MAG: DUF695 domain-containing protein [Eubacteriales bacterium]|nr:DUF695 domain-containing protein [Eubacteriales bacterium]